MASDVSRSRVTVPDEHHIIAALLNRFNAVNDYNGLDQNHADHELNKLPQSIWIHLIKIFSMTKKIKKIPNEANYFFFFKFSF